MRVLPCRFDFLFWYIVIHKKQRFSKQNVNVILIKKESIIVRMGCGWLLGLMEYESSFNIMLLIRFKKYKYKSVGRVPSPPLYYY